MEREASDPNSSTPTSLETRCRLHLEMHGGRESEGERESREEGRHAAHWKLPPSRSTPVA
jgi:hypothetical protein